MKRHAAFAALVMMLIGASSVSLAEPPQVLYETFIPGYYIPHAYDIVVDKEGCAYFLATAYENGSSLDLIVIKLDPDGNEVWTYHFYGGGHNFGKGLALDSSGDLWVTGWTDSESFPLVNPMDSTFQAREMFLMKLASETGEILYSTYIGGDYTDVSSAIVLNDADEIFLVGWSGSTDFPTTPDAFQGEPSFPEYFYQDAVILKLAPTGDEILYSSYFGGTHDDWGDHIALDGDGNIIIAGRSNADDFLLVEAYDSEPNDIFISKLSPDGQTLLFSSFFGGSDYDRLMDMKCDDAGNVYMTGSTRSVDMPTTPGAYQAQFVGEINGCEVPFGSDYNCEDWYVCNLSTEGAGMNWCTYLGGDTVDEPRAIHVDRHGSAFVAGYSSSQDFPLYDGTFGAIFMVCKLSDGGTELDWNYFVESGSANRGNGVALDAAGDIYLTGTVGVPASLYVGKLQGDRVTGLDDGTAAGPGPILSANFPNPFNPRTSIAYLLPDGGETSRVSLIVYDVGGRQVKILVDEVQPAGEYGVAWDGRDDSGAEVGAGLYFYRLSWGEERLSRSMVLLK